MEKCFARQPAFEAFEGGAGLLLRPVLADRDEWAEE
jgi:hypothetical protein